MSSSQTDTSQDKEQQSTASAGTDEDVRLWQSALAVPFQREDFKWGRVEADQHLYFLKSEVKNRVENCERPFHNIFRTLWRSGVGVFMIFRSTIFRAKTHSWTFPFQIAFGPFWVAILLFAIWGALIHNASIDRNVAIQVALVVHLFVCWLGLGYRMDRLCAMEGDRTIESWFWRTIVLRRDAFRVDEKMVIYCGWFPARACT